MAWPTSQDYNEAIQSPASAFSEPELRGGEARANAMGMPLPRSGNFADVYEFTGASGAKWAVKCFTREVAGLQERYHEISRFLQKAKLPFMVEFQYLAQGIRISGRWYPVLKMNWVDGYLLNEFVSRNLNKPRILEALGEIWVRMAQRLRGAGIAHADLQHGNVILVPGSKAGSLAVKLIDYDGMFVPALAAKPSGEVGHPNFQHPQRLEKNIYNADVDRLPFLSVACALRALVAAGPSLWEKYDNGDNLLFRAKDLAKPGESKLLRELWSLNDAELHDLVAYLVSGLTNPLRETPLLPDLMRDNALQPPPPVMVHAAQEILGPGATITRAAGKAVTPVRPAGTWEEAYDPFADLVSSTTIASIHRRRKSKASGKKWALWGGLGLGGTAALILVTVLALSGGSKDDASRAENKPPPVEDKKPKEQQVVEPKPQPPDDPARKKQPDAERPIALGGSWRLEGAELVQDSFAVPAALLVGSPNWGDCDLAVDVKTTQGADSIWLPIGATETGDHDAFFVGGFDKQGEAALVHAASGKMEVEGARSPARLERNTWHSVTVKRRGDYSSIYVDGTLAAEGSTALPAHFGLGAMATKARFRNLKITDPEGNILCAALPEPLQAQKPDRPQIAGGIWRVEDDELVQDGRSNPAMLFFGSAAWSDYDVTLNCKAVEGAEGFMICFRALDPGNFHCFNLGGNGNKIHELVCFANGRAARDTPPTPGRIEVDRWYEATVKVRGQDIACYLGGKVLFQAKDELLPKGKVGLRTFNTKARFRDIKVTDPKGKELWSGLPSLEAAPSGSYRVLWLYDKGFFRQGREGAWHEQSDNRNYSFMETSRTDDMVELYDKSRNLWIHLHRDSCWLRQGEKNPWGRIYSGQWKSVPFLIAPTSPKDVKSAPVAKVSTFFNGKDLTGWDGLDGFWRVEDEPLVGAVPEGKNPISTFLCTTKPYRDFDLKFQARLKDGIGNSGVQFRSKISDFDKFTVTGPQCEICGDDGQRLYPTGSIFHEPKGKPILFAPIDKVKQIFKEDQFNDYHIHVKHKHVSVQLNGEKLVDDEYPNMPTSGIIALQLSARSPPREAAFRNFEFTDLRSDFYALFDGKTLNGWKAVLNDAKADPKKTFLVKDGTLVVTGKPAGNVHTVVSYKNYVIRFEWRFKRPAELKDESQFKGDSGLYLHMTSAAKGAIKCVQIQITQQEFGRFIPMNGPKGGYQFNRVALMGARRSVGDWNETEVTCNDGAITCKLNGVQVSNGKYDCDQGNIGLESIGGEEVQFRQIMLKEIWPGDELGK